jgi:hypothetical protein
MIRRLQLQHDEDVRELDVIKAIEMKVIEERGTVAKEAEPYPLQLIWHSKICKE